MLKQDVRLREDEFITDLSPSEESTEDVVGLREDEFITDLSLSELDTVTGGFFFQRLGGVEPGHVIDGEYVYY